MKTNTNRTIRRSDFIFADNAAVAISIIRVPYFLLILMIGPFNFVAAVGSY